MASVSTAVKRAFVRYLLRLAVSSSTTLLACIEAASDARIISVAGGKVLSSNSGNGHVVSFYFPDDFTAMDSIELLSEIQDRYEESKAALGGGTDAAIGADMLDKLVAVRSIEKDYSGLRTCVEVVD